MLSILIPMAGQGRRFVEAGYTDPKPLIKIGSKRMIELVIDNIRPKAPHRFIFLIQKDHDKDGFFSDLLRKNEPNSIIIHINGLTEGAACTALLAADHIVNTELMIANSDQFIDASIDDFIEYSSQDFDGVTMTMKASDPKWSYVLTSGSRVIKVAEKEVISSFANVGIYYYKSANQFISYTKEMISKNIRTNGEFYIAPVYNEYILDDKNIAIYDICDRMFGLGTPEDLTYYLKTKE